METAKYVESFGGWLAFKHGKTVQGKRGIKVFKTEAEALKAAKASRMGFGCRVIGRRWR